MGGRDTEELILQAAAAQLSHCIPLCTHARTHTLVYGSTVHSHHAHSALTPPPLFLPAPVHQHHHIYLLTQRLHPYSYWTTFQYESVRSSQSFCTVTAGQKTSIWEAALRFTSMKYSLSDSCYREGSICAWPFVKNQYCNNYHIDMLKTKVITCYKLV